MRLLKSKIFKQDDGPPIAVSEKKGVRTLYLGNSTEQSAMRINAPFDLEVPYTRAMMAFLLFHGQPRNVAMIGLGGGSLAKFIYHHFQQTKITVIEINPSIISVARSCFCLPEDDERLSVMVGDGAEYVKSSPNTADVLMVDGFDENNHVPALHAQAFYDNCASTLEADGVLVANLWGGEKDFTLHLTRIQQAFHGRVLCLPPLKHRNIIVFAFKADLGPQRWDALTVTGNQLKRQYGLEFHKFVENLKQLNLYDRRYLFI